MGFSSARNLGRDISAGFSPPRRMPISEAVKKFMRVPKGAGNSVPWDPELTPYIIEPMNCLASREYDAVIFVGPARTGKTIGLIDGWIVYTIVCDPSDMLVVQMTEDKAREHSKKRLDRTFRSSAAVKKRMSPRRNDNNVHDKTFRDGSFLKIGWPSVNIMSSSDSGCRQVTRVTRIFIFMTRLVSGVLASEHIAPLQDAADLEIATEEEISLLEAWKKYRVLLNRVDTSTAQDIEWPALP